MNFELATFPATLDMLHLGLVILVLIFAVLFFKKQPVSASSQDNSNKTPLSNTPTQLKESTPDAALQLLTLLQKEARLIDFAKEDLTGHSDADVGAAARVVHQGSKKAIESYFDLEPIRKEEEESRVSLPEGFNASEVRLTGNVVGEAPFTGTLIHKGWKVTEVKLPKLAEGHDTNIVAPAEVEL